MAQRISFPGTGFLRRLTATVLLAFSLVFVLIAIGLGLLQISFLRQGLLGYALQKVEAEVSIGSLEGEWPARLILRDLRLHDAEGDWLTAANLTLDWRPMALLRGELHITSLLLSGVALSRTPDGNDTPQEEFSFPTLPFPLRLEHFDITDVTLGESLAGKDAKLQAQGHVIWSRRYFDAALDATRIDGVEGAVTARALINTAQRLADINIHAKDSAPADQSPVAILAGDRSFAPAQLDLNYQARNGHVTGTTKLLAGQALHFDAQAEGQWEESLDLDVKLRAAGAQIRAALEGLGDAQAALASGKLRWDTKDTLSLTNLSLEAGPLLFTGDISFGRVSRHTPHPVQGRGVLQGLDVILDAPDNALLSAAPWQIEGMLSAGSDTLVIDRFTLGSDQGALRFSGDLDFGNEVLKGDAVLTFPSLSGLGELADIRLSGQGEVQISPFVLHLNGDAAGDLALRFNQIVSDDELLNGALAGKLNGDGSFLYSTKKGLSLPFFEMAGADNKTRLWGNLNLPRGNRLDGTVMLDVAELGALLPDMFDGKLAATAIFGGSAQQPKISLDAALDQGSVVGLDAAKATLKGDVVFGGTGQVTFTLDGSDGHINASTALALPAAGGAKLDALEMQMFGATLSGALAFSPDWIADGRIESKGPLLRPISAISGLPIQGSGELALLFSNVGGRQKASFFLLSPLAQLNLGTDIRLNKLSATGEVTDLFGRADIQANLKAESGSTDDITINRMEASATGPLNELTLKARLRGTHELLKPEDIVFDAEAQLEDQTLHVSVLSYKKGERSLMLATPVNIALANGVMIKGLELQTQAENGNGQLNADFDLRARVATLQASVRNFPLSLLQPVLPIDYVQGAVNGEVILDTGRGTGQTTLRFEDILLSEIQQLEEPEPLTADLTTQWKAGRADLSLSAGSKGQRQFILTASLPVIRDPQGAWPTLAKRGAVSADLSWRRGSVAPLFALLDSANQRMTGDADVVLQVSGDVSAPIINGTASIRNGSYEHFGSGTVLRQVELQAQANSSEALSFSLSANDTGAGKISAEGHLSFSSAAAHAIAVTAKFEQARLVRRPELEMAVSGVASVTGEKLPPDADHPLTLSGELVATTTELRVPDHMPASVAEIDVIEINGMPRTRAPTTEPGIPILLDLSLSIERPMRVSGRGIDTLWRGELQASGSGEAPIVTGELRSLQGTAGFAGKTFVLKRGSVKFDGGRTIDPQIDALLSYSRSNLTANIVVSGRSSNPAINFTSEPQLPRDEIFSRILFDKGVGELTGFEAVQLATSLAELSGSGLGGGGILNSLQRSIGLDVLRIDTAKSGATTLTAGEYLSESIYVGVEQGALASDSSIKVEIEVSPRITVDTKLGHDASGGAGINWRWDY